MSEAPALHPAVMRVRDRAEAYLKKDDGWIAFATDARTFSKPDPKKTGKPAMGLLAVATPVGSLVIAIDMSEWKDAQLTLLELVGVPKATKDAYAEAEKAKATK